MSSFATRAPRSFLPALAVVLAWGATAWVVRADPAKPAAKPAKATAGAIASSVGFAPDPPVSSSTRTYRFPVRVHDGAVVVDKPKLVTHPQAMATPRTLGRYAIELYVGRELLERHRFDLPFLDEPTKKPSPGSAPDFARHANAKVFVDLPDLDRATYAVWVDRATGAKKRLFWPPVDDFTPMPLTSSSVVAPAVSSSVSASAAPTPAASASAR